MFNLYQKFLDLIPDPALQVGDVIAAVDGIVTLELPGGGYLKARGQASVGQRVFVRGGVVEGEAPQLPVELIEV